MTKTKSCCRYQAGRRWQFPSATQPSGGVWWLAGPGAGGAVATSRTATAAGTSPSAVAGIPEERNLPRIFGSNFPEPVAYDPWRVLLGVSARSLRCPHVTV